jgi:hypothetical protein
LSTICAAICAAIDAAHGAALRAAVVRSNNLSADQSTLVHAYNATVNSAVHAAKYCSFVDSHFWSYSEA